VSTGIEGIFQPSLRHWQEYIETERLRLDVKPALGPGPKGGPVEVNLKTGAVVIDVAAVQREEDLRELRREGLA